MSTGGTAARDVIFMRLRAGVAGSESLFRAQPDPTPEEGVPSAVVDVEGSGLTLAKAFCENLSAALGTYEILDNAADVPEAVVARIERWRRENECTDTFGSELLSWAPGELSVPSLSGRLEQLGASLLVPDDLHDLEERERAARLQVGLTGVDAAFAGTGSMVLVPGPGKSRAASLFPLHHIALVPISKIFSTFETWLALLRSKGTLEGLFRKHAQLAFVTGPSKSADIELNLTLGVHGPRDVHAVVFDDSRTGR